MTIENETIDSNKLLQILTVFFDDSTDDKIIIRNCKAHHNESESTFTLELRIYQQR